MCQKCISTAKRLFPEIADNEINNFLMGHTCYMFGSIEDVTENLIDLSTTIYCGLRPCIMCGKPTNPFSDDCDRCIEISKGYFFGHE